MNRKKAVVEHKQLYMPDAAIIAEFARTVWQTNRDFALILGSFVNDLAKHATPDDDIKMIALLRDRLLCIEIDGSLRVSAVVKVAVMELIAEVNAGRWPRLRYEYSEAA